MFKKLIEKTRTFLQARQMSCSINKLQKYIHVDVVASKPTTLFIFIGLTCLYEAQNLS